jgi:putative transposase
LSQRPLADKFCFVNHGEEPGRKGLPHLAPKEFPNQSIIIYVTQVVAGRRSLLARQEAVEALLNAWGQADHWLIGRYVVMPDHLHLFCAPVRHPFTPVKQWMSFWRAEATRNWPWPGDKPIWQKDFFDRQLRRGESYAEKWRYVRENPVRAGLASDADEWPWQGEMNSLMWHEAARD